MLNIKLLLAVQLKLITYTFRCQKVELQTQYKTIKISIRDLHAQNCKLLTLIVRRLEKFLLCF